MNPKEAGVAETTPTNTAQRVDKKTLALLHYKHFAIHCALQISIRLLGCVLGWLDAMIVVRERITGWRWIQ